MNGSLGWALDRATLLSPAKEAVVCGRHRLTYEQFNDRVAALGGGLQELGVKPGDVIGVLALNSLEHLECWLAVPRLGMVLNDLNYRLAPTELAFILHDSGTQVLIVDDANLPMAKSLLAECPSLKALVYTGANADIEGVVSYADLLSGSRAVAADLDDDALAAIFYTGGTTGLPKGAMLSHANVIANAKQLAAAIGLSANDRFLHAGPMFHLADGAFTYTITWMGGSHVIIPAFEPEAVQRAIQDESVTVSVLVPTMFNAIVNHPSAGQFDLSSLRLVLYGGSPMPLELQRRVARLVGCEMVQGYGMTEASPLLTVLTAEDHRRGMTGEEPYATRLRSAGSPILGVQVEVRLANRSPAKPNEEGEVWARGPNIMLGYWNRPQETKAALVEGGWYRTGDAAYMDEDGYLYIVDRVKDMIISGGENVYSTEVENVLYDHPAILECAVIGIPDEKWGERVHAVVALKDGFTATEEELVDYCRGRIGGYKLPRSITFHNGALPKSGAGKILKRELKKEFWEGHERRVH